MNENQDRPIFQFLNDTILGRIKVPTTVRATESSTVVAIVLPWQIKSLIASGVIVKMY